MRENPYGDSTVYIDMEKTIMRHVQAALIECSSIATDLTCEDPMKVMAKLNEHFTRKALDDNFTDALYEFRDNLMDKGLSYADAHNKPRKVQLINMRAAAE